MLGHRQPPLISTIKTFDIHVWGLTECFECLHNKICDIRNLILPFVEGLNIFYFGSFENCYVDIYYPSKTILIYADGQKVLKYIVTPDGEEDYRKYYFNTPPERGIHPFSKVPYYLELIHDNYVRDASIVEELKKHNIFFYQDRCYTED